MERVSPTPSPRHVPRAMAGTGGYRCRSNTKFIDWWHRTKKTARESVNPFQRYKLLKSVMGSGRLGPRILRFLPDMVECLLTLAIRSYGHKAEECKAVWRGCIFFWTYRFLQTPRKILQFAVFWAPLSKICYNMLSAAPQHISQHYKQKRKPQQRYYR